MLDISKLEQDEEHMENQEMDYISRMKPSLILSIIGYIFVMMLFLEVTIDFLIQLRPYDLWFLLLLFVILILAIWYTWFHFHRFRKKKKNYMEMNVYAEVSEEKKKESLNAISMKLNLF